MPRFVPTVGESHHRHHARASDQTLIKSRFLCFFEVLNRHRDFVIAELYGVRVMPVTQDTTVISAEVNVSPAEGTA